MPPDVLVLDLGLPGLDGLRVCERLRAQADRHVPVLMLTARDALEDKLLGFRSGADDYLVKPFALPELEARLRAVARRGRPSGPLACGPLVYDPDVLAAQRDGRQIPLTRLQGALLEILLQEAPRIVPHARLIERAWGAAGADMAALQTQVYELRALVDRPFAQPMIQSVRGVGYRVAAPA